MKGHDYQIDCDIDDYTADGPLCKQCGQGLTRREVKDEQTICDECHQKINEETEPQ